MIHLLDQLLDANTLQSVQMRLQQLPESAWESGQQSAGQQARQSKNNQQLPSDHAVSAHIRQAVLASLDQSAHFFSAALPLRVFPPCINRYTPEHPCYGLHVDNAIRARMGGHPMRTDLSCTVFLNAPDTYQGGELMIHDHDAQHRIKLKAGDAVLYPAGTLHEVTPVTQGQRIACFFWIESMVARHDQRQLLWELDVNLLQLRQQLGEQRAEIIALTGLYHNLLRQWATT